MMVQRGLYEKLFSNLLIINQNAPGLIPVTVRMISAVCRRVSISGPDVWP